MPNDTFFNLSQDKRELIETVAIDEFATYGFDMASINRIIVDCNIAKGSFYQYFQDKTDLFKYLMAKAVEEKKKFLSPLLSNPEELDFFTLMREMYASGLKFANANPKLVNIGNRLLKDKNHPIYKEVMGDNMVQLHDIFGYLLKAAIARGEVSPGIDIPFMSYMISAMNITTVEYYQEIVLGGKDLVQLDEEMMVVINRFIDFLKYGISSTRKGGNNHD